MPVQVNVDQAKSDLSRLVARAQAGEEVIIMRDGETVARVVPTRHERVSGLGRGKVRIAPDFDKPLPQDMLRSFEAR